jgi:adenylate cyclase
MGIWGEPIKVDRPEYRACRAILRCSKALQDNAQQWIDRGLPALSCRIGVHAGSCMIGNFGSTHKLNYTCLGDAVNLAARLEPLCKYYGTSNIISSDIFVEVKEDMACRLIDIIMVKGKRVETVIYEVMAESGDATSAQLDMGVLSEELLELLLKCDVSGSLRSINKMMNIEGYKNDKALKLLRDRIQPFVDKPQEFTPAAKFEEKSF